MINLNEELVAEFHKLFDHPVKERPGIPDKQRRALRIALISEELEELKIALDNSNLLEAADALADLQYVLSGTILELGLHNHFREIFKEVHRSNMSKACDTFEQAHLTVELYKEKFPEFQFSITQKLDKYIVVRSDGKTVKSIDYSPADIEKVLNE